MLLHDCAQYEISVLQLVPSVIDLIVEYLNTNISLAKSLHSLKWLISTGELLTPRTVNSWLETFPNTPIVNDYGPAECADTVCVEILTKPVELNMKVPLGKAFPGTRFYIVNPDFKEVPPNSLGEILISGPGVGYGYYKNNSLTLEKFRPDPYDPSQSCYLTGDMGKIDNDGKLIFSGRLDQQCKRFGYRFDLNDISQTATLHPSLKFAVCILIENQAVLFYSEKIKNSLSPMHLNDFLVANLPTYAIPDKYLLVDEFKYLMGGKIDRRFLTSFYANNVATENSRDNSNDKDVEDTILNILTKILGSLSINPENNFFTQGGN